MHNYYVHCYTDIRVIIMHVHDLVSYKSQGKEMFCGFCVFSMNHESFPDECLVEQ